ncbi:MAG: polysaccharide deacetylase family protein [Cyanobacteria bacterium P01_F01_bin.86]
MPLRRNSASLSFEWDAASFNSFDWKSIDWQSISWDSISWDSLSWNSLPLSWDPAASATPNAASLGLVAQTSNVQGIDAFPREVSASHLCPLPTGQPSEPESFVSSVPEDEVSASVPEGEASSPVQNSEVSASTQETEVSASGEEGEVSSLLMPSLQGVQIGVSLELVQQLAAAPWPELHESARIARVPVLMYHDILEEKEVFFDVTVEELEEHFARIEEEGLTPITFDQLTHHLRTGAPLPPKPVLLTFDDGYEGHYTHAYQLLKEYQYPAVFSLFTGKMDGEVAGRSTVTWEQAQEMAADPLITIASHGVTHPPDLRVLDDDDLYREVFDSKARLEEKLGIPIRYFTYPVGYYDDRVAGAVEEASYEAALTMSNYDDWFAGESESMLAIGRFGQSQLERVIPEAWEGLAVPIVAEGTFDFASPIRAVRRMETEEVPLALVTGGRPVTIHADSRYQLPEILARTNAIAAVDGAFFSLEYLDSNVMIGPVLSQSTQTFVPGNVGENPLLNGRPLALISPDAVQFVPFDANRHNTLQGLQAEMTNVTDAFVGAAWLVRDGEPQEAETFGTLFDFEAYRHRAFWGINKAGQPVLGVTKGRIDSVGLGELLHAIGFREAMMVDSGASTSLAYREESLVDYIPRPVPHLIALLPEEEAQGACPLIVEEVPSYEDDWSTSYW